MSSLHISHELRAVTAVTSPSSTGDFSALGQKKMSQKRSAKATEDADELRRQRQRLERALRRTKRDAELEKRRHVFESLNRLAWSSDDEDGDVEPAAPSQTEELAAEIERVNALAESDMNMFLQTVRNNASSLPMTISMLESSESHLVLAAVKLLTTLTALEKDFVTTFVTHGGLQHLPALLSHELTEVQFMATKILSNVTSCGDEYIEQMMQCDGVVQGLINVLYFGSRNSQTMATEVSLNIVRIGSRQHLLALVEADFIDAMSDMLTRKDSESLYLALSAISSLLERAERFNCIHRVLETTTTARSYVEQIYNENPQEAVWKEADRVLVYFDRYATDDDVFE